MGAWGAGIVRSPRRARQPVNCVPDAAPGRGGFFPRRHEMRNRTMKRCLALLATLLLAACGAAGGLYLPDHPHQHDSPLRKDPRKTDGQAAPQPAAPGETPAPAPADNGGTPPPQTTQP
jgi:predicted small lipoprotein YifL